MKTGRNDDSEAANSLAIKTRSGAPAVSILIIEDDPGDALRLRYDLDSAEGIDFSMTHADRVEDGLRLIERGHFDAVLLDLTLPEGDGTGVLARARLAFSSVPVIVMANEDDQDLALEAVRLGAQGYLVKQRYEVRDLVQAIRHAVTRHVKLSELQEATQREHFRATHDRLTGLYNQAALQDFMQRCLAQARRLGARVAVLFLDLDRFKQVNDQFGHDVGDQLLRMVATRLLAATRRSNMTARVGGDEFVLLLQDIEEDHVAARVAEIVVGLLATPFVIEGIEHTIGVSIGIAVYPRDAIEPADLIRRADTAMYHAKAKGRNGFHFYAEGMDAVAAERLAVEAALRGARSRDELRLHYQPVIDPTTERVVALGGLLRWQRGERILVAREFLSMAERIGVLDDIGSWVLQTACADAAGWDIPDREDFRVVVKATLGQLEERHFTDRVTRALREQGLEPRRLAIEVRQSCQLQASRGATTTLRDLRDLGIKIIVEGLGGGCSSFSALKHQRMDAMKVGGSLVRGAIHDPFDQAAIGAIFLLARALSVETVATGVETVAERNLLVGLGCTRLQGNLYSEPVEARAIPELLRRFGVASVSAGRDDAVETEGLVEA